MRTRYEVCSNDNTDCGTEVLGTYESLLEAIYWATALEEAGVAVWIRRIS